MDEEVIEEAPPLALWKKFLYAAAVLGVIGLAFASAGEDFALLAFAIAGALLHAGLLGAVIEDVVRRR